MNPDRLQSVLCAYRRRVCSSKATNVYKTSADSWELRDIDFYDVSELGGQRKGSCTGLRAAPVALQIQNTSHRCPRYSLVVNEKSRTVQSRFEQVDLDDGVRTKEILKLLENTDGEPLLTHLFPFQGGVR